MVVRIKLGDYQTLSDDSSAGAKDHAVAA